MSEYMPSGPDKKATTNFFLAVTANALRDNDLITAAFCLNQVACSAEDLTIDACTKAIRRIYKQDQVLAVTLAFLAWRDAGGQDAKSEFGQLALEIADTMGRDNEWTDFRAVHFIMNDNSASNQSLKTAAQGVMDRILNKDGEKILSVKPRPIRMHIETNFRTEETREIYWQARHFARTGREITSAEPENMDKLERLKAQAEQEPIGVFVAITALEDVSVIDRPVWLKCREILAVVLETHQMSPIDFIEALDKEDQQPTPRTPLLPWPSASQPRQEPF